KACLLRHVNCIVEYNDTAVANQAVASSERLVIERGVKKCPREICPERSTHLYRPHRAPARRAAADIVDQFAQREAECSLEQAAIFDIARELNRHCAARFPDAEVSIGGGTLF